MKKRLGERTGSAPSAITVAGPPARSSADAAARDGRTDRPAPVRPAPGRSAWIIATEAAVILSVAIVLRVPGLMEGALHDELYNYLAARGFLREGAFTIVGGAEPYARGVLFTRVVAAFLDVLGESLAVGRLPALLAGSLLATTLFLWLRIAGERWAGWIAALLVAADPLLVQLSQIVRFYTFQHLAFVLGAAGVYALCVRRPSWPMTAGLGGLSAAALATAVRLQLVSVIGIAGIGLFLGAVALPGAARRLRHSTRRGSILGAAAVVLLGGAYAVLRTGIVREMMAMATFADLWAVERVGDLRFYYVLLHDHYAPAWTLFPLLMLLALHRRPRLAGLAASVVVVAFAVHSLLAWKAGRYIAYVLPFFFIVVALGTVHAAPRLLATVRRLLRELAVRAGAPVPRRLLRPVAVSAVAVIGASAAVGNRAFLDTAQLATRDHAFAFPLMGENDGTLSWRRFAERVGPVVDSVDVIVSSDDLKAIHHLGRVDYALSPSHLYQQAGIRPEFSLDPRTDVPVISSAASVAAVMACHESGLFVIQRMSIDGPVSRAEATEYAAAHAERLDLPDAWGMAAFRWRTPAGERRTDCEEIRPRRDIWGRPVASATSGAGPSP